MELKVSGSGKQFSIEIIGAIDNLSADQLRTTFEKVSSIESPEVRLDLTGVTTINSIGIGKIMMLYKNVKASGGNVSIEGISNNLREIFELMKLNKIIPIADEK